ncbi:hypothetical protein [Myceligenerans pegani]|uniref:Uncharacterized protein n=1 Tax=Myceligenerans pegani TaxID=2776917 RepID=A0ABR9N1I2_9MICO|nr:hypothetical protein [Myceligenerans sp. TRM 65318]MBE1877210.1 hypothetical protein [Myceligenerans sp. TRM 65318]MBE3019481.1 hypothetical protein [Myceligenerans sp. TRM 65318]
MTEPTFRTLSAIAFALAVLAGIAETAIVLASIDPAQADGGLLPQLALRGLVFAGALVCAWFLARGRRWAWWALLLGLGVLGLASMVLPPAAELAAGTGWYDALGGDTSAAFPVLRGLHIALVVTGVAAMIRPEVRGSLGAARATARDDRPAAVAR